MNNIIKLFDANNPQELKRMINPRTQTISQLLYLDLNNTSSDTDPLTRPRWYINHSTPIYTPGTVNVNLPLENVISMRLRDINFSVRQSEKSRRLSMYVMYILIEELQSQCNLGLFNFHFASKKLNYDPQANGLKYSYTFSTFEYNDGRFYFYKPIDHIDKITLNLRLHDYPFSFDAETLTASVTPLSNPARLTFATEHGLVNAQITISGFTTGDPITDASIIAAMNTTHSTYTVLDDYTITLPIDLSSTTPLVSHSVQVYSSTGLNFVLEVNSLVNI